MAMTTRVLAPAEVPPKRQLYVVQRGVVLYGGRCFSRGMAWGDDVILEDPSNFLPFSARSMTYVDVMQIGRETLLDIVRAFPASARVLRRAQIVLALKRRIIHGARAAKERSAQVMGLGLSDVPAVSIFDASGGGGGTSAALRGTAKGGQDTKILAVDMAVALEQSGRAAGQSSGKGGGRGGGGGGGGVGGAEVSGGSSGGSPEAKVNEMKAGMKAEMASLHAAIAKLGVTLGGGSPA
jgi:hypothetical protein